MSTITTLTKTSAQQVQDAVILLRTVQHRQALLDLIDTYTRMAQNPEHIHDSLAPGLAKIALALRLISEVD